MRDEIGIVKIFYDWRKIKMKKELICIATAAMLTAAAPLTFAEEGVTYDTGNKAVNVQAQEGKQTVLITNNDTNDIVYVNQEKNGFSKAQEFLIKNTAADGTYTVTFGGDTTPVTSKTLYIGMQSSGVDIQLTKPESGAEADAGSGMKNIGYIASNITGGPYRTVIIKKSDNKYYGVGLNTHITLENGAVGIQINGVSDENAIQGVWISQRDITTATAQ